MLMLLQQEAYKTTGFCWQAKLSCGTEILLKKRAIRSNHVDNIVLTTCQFTC